MSDSDPTPPSAPLSDTDAQALYLYGLDITQDAVGVIWETVFISEPSELYIRTVVYVLQAHTEFFSPLLSIPSCNYYFRPIKITFLMGWVYSFAAAKASKVGARLPCFAS
jgi:hypothetical protein